MNQREFAWNEEEELVPVSAIKQSPFYPVAPEHPEVVEFARSYLANGQETALTITTDGSIVATEHCFAAMKRAGFQSVWCIRWRVGRGDHDFITLMYQVTRDRVEEYDDLPPVEKLPGKLWSGYLNAGTNEGYAQNALLTCITKILEPLIGFWPLSVFEIQQLLNELSPFQIPKEDELPNEANHRALSDLLRSAVHAGTIAHGAVQIPMGGSKS